MRNDIERAVDTVLSGLATTPAQREQLIQTALKTSVGAEPPPRKFFEQLPSIRMPRLAMIAIAAVLLMLLPLLPQPQKDPFVRYSSEDGQDYYVTGSGEPTSSTSAIASSGRIAPGSYSGLSFEDAERVYGTRIPRMNWLPGDAVLTHLFVEVSDMDRTVVIRYENDQGSIFLTIDNFFTEEIAMMWFPQNEEGEYITLANGVQAYITTNVTRHTITWQEGYTVYHLSGVVSREELLRMMESIR